MDSRANSVTPPREGQTQDSPQLEEKKKRGLFHSWLLMAERAQAILDFHGAESAATHLLELARSKQIVPEGLEVGARFRETPVITE